MKIEEFVQDHPEFNNAQLFEYIRKKNLTVEFSTARLTDLLNNETNSISRYDELIAYMIDNNWQKYIKFY
ncbi:hypothetical protein [Paucilactobacillus sp. N302-9]